MKVHAWIICILLLGVFANGCAFTQKPLTGNKTEGRNDFDCWPPSCSFIPDPYGKQMCEDWKAGKEIKWPSDCSMMPVSLGCQKLCEFEKKGNVISEQKHVISEQKQKAHVEIDSCSSTNEIFSVSPLALTDFTSIAPLGQFSPPAHIFPTNHIYLYLIRDGPPAMPNAMAPPAQVPVVAPGNITIFKIASQEYLTYLSSDRQDFKQHTDYAIDFASCNEVYSRFGHLSSLSDKIISQLVEPYDSCTTSTFGYEITKICFKTVNIKLNAGDAIGTAGGQNGSGNLDFFTFDTRINNSFANPARWVRNREDINTVCPLDYFTSSLVLAFKSRLGDISGNKREIEPTCGEISQDIAGTAQGRWLLKGTAVIQSESPHLALAHGSVNPKKGVFSVGTSMTDKGLKSGQYYFDPTQSGFVNHDFNSLKADGNIYCYETKESGFAQINGKNPSFAASTPPTTIIIQMPTDSTLRIEKLNQNTCGSGPWSFSNYGEYER